MSGEASKADIELLQDVIEKIAANVSMLVDRPIEVESMTASRAAERVAGRSKVHISFKLQFTEEGGKQAFGCVLVPLPDALSLACYLMMFPEGEVEAHRNDETLDPPTKEALLELGNFIGAAVDESLRSKMSGTSARSSGCQGVRANVRPAFPYQEGSELVVGRARTRVHSFPAFELIAMLPALPIAA